MPEASATLSAFVERMEALGGAPTGQACLDAARATLGLLAGRLTRAERMRLGAALPVELRECLETGDGGRESFETLHATQRPVALLFADVAQTLHLPPGRAVEATQVVCRVVAEAIPESVRALLRDHPAHDLAALFLLPGDEGSCHEATRPRRGWTLAEAPPGSRRPLSESAATLAHSGSVAAANPARTARTLACYRGNATGETLATGAPGSRRKLADGT